MKAEEAYKLTKESNRYASIVSDIKASAMRGRVCITVELPSWEVQERLREDGYLTTIGSSHITITWDSHRIASQRRLSAKARRAREEANVEELQEHGTRAWWAKLLRRC